VCVCVCVCVCARAHYIAWVCSRLFHLGLCQHIPWHLHGNLLNNTFLICPTVRQCGTAIDSHRCECGSTSPKERLKSPEAVCRAWPSQGPRKACPGCWVSFRPERAKGFNLPWVGDCLLGRGQCIWWPWGVLEMEEEWCVRGAKGTGCSWCLDILGYHGADDSNGLSKGSHKEPHGNPRGNWEATAEF
jgi:hypothetical protein